MTIDFILKLKLMFLFVKYNHYRFKLHHLEFLNCLYVVILHFKKYACSSVICQGYKGYIVSRNAIMFGLEYETEDCHPEILQFEYC